MTGITDDMVAGQRIDPDVVSAFVADAVIVIAHNAGFDRMFAERYWPIFEQMAWGCRATEVDWRSYGFAGAQLGYLLHGIGFFHQAHRAVDDCRALLGGPGRCPADHRRAGAVGPAADRAQSDRAGLGGAVPLRTQGRPEEGRVPLV